MCIESRGDTAFAVPRCTSKINQLIKNHKRGKCHVFCQISKLHVRQERNILGGNFPLCVERRGDAVPRCARRKFTSSQATSAIAYI